MLEVRLTRSFCTRQSRDLGFHRTTGLRHQHIPAKYQDSESGASLQSSDTTLTCKLALQHQQTITLPHLKSQSGLENWLGNMCIYSDIQGRYNLKALQVIHLSEPKKEQTVKECLGQALLSCLSGTVCSYS